MILDLDLPDVSGRTLIPEMVARCPALSIVVYSGLNGPRFGLENRLQLHIAGAYAFVWKPSGGQKLLDVLKELTETPPSPMS